MTTLTPVPAFTDNYIWVIARAGHAIAVDPGDAAPLAAFLDAQRLDLAAILVTHHHRDHTGGIAALVARHRCPVHGPGSIGATTHPVREGDRLAFAALGITFEVLETPGHTRDHVAYYGANLLFCGDTLFGCGCGRLFEGSPAEMTASLDKILALPDTTQVCAAHEYTLANIAFARRIDPANAALCQRERDDRAARAAGLPTLPSTLALEKATNPFLRFRHPDMIAFAEGCLGRRDLTAAEVFAAIRAAKDAADG
jgi:hydroxyacylglutathione hydrolase